jgi:hypothetical protein
VIRPGTQLHLLHGCFDQVAAGFIKRAELANLGGTHIGVGLQGNPLKPLRLHGPHCLGPFPDPGAGFANAPVAELFKENMGHFDARSVSIRSMSGPDIFFW